MWLTVEEPQLRAVIEEAIETVLQVAQAPFWHEARAAEHFVETPFLVSADQRQLLNGVIDLLHKHGRGWAITDYKSDLRLEGESPEPYQHQIAQYQQALTRCGLTIEGASIRTVRARPSRVSGDE
jgi:ATP-dependent exoDNAse (exonuclease V) beta subunit